MDRSLLVQFDEQMLDLYRRIIAEAGFKPVLLLQMVGAKGGLQTARELITRNTPSDGYTRLYELGQLQLTVEAIVYDNPRWYPLFTVSELEACKQRLIEYGYIKPLSS